MPRGSGSRSNTGVSRYNLSPAGHTNSLDAWTFDAEQLSDAIRAVLANGDAVLFSLTSDGGALGVQLYAGGEKQSVYVKSGEELDTLSATLRDSRLDK